MDSIMVPIVAGFFAYMFISMGSDPRAFFEGWSRLPNASPEVIQRRASFDRIGIAMAERYGKPIGWLLAALSAVSFFWWLAG